MRRGVKAIVSGSGLGLCLGVGAVGCGGGSAEITERLWVTSVPTSAKEGFSAFLTARSGNELVGAFFRGSFVRGSYDAFKWRDTGKGKAEVVMLQDDRKVELRIRACEPSSVFDHCIIVDSDLTGPVKYQSRKRWVVRRPGRKGLGAGALFEATLLELAEDDEALEAALEAVDESIDEPREPSS